MTPPTPPRWPPTFWRRPSTALARRPAWSPPRLGWPLKCRSRSIGSWRGWRPVTSRKPTGGTTVRSMADTPDTAAEIMDLLAPEHLEILAEDLDFYFHAMHNYGSLFLGTWSTVAYSDKGMSGTNHTLPTARNARFTGGLSVSRYLKQLTYQR